ncbi:MAG: hypothetical protein H7Z76_07290 [Methylotenera sp.]|nr:hypothetical protein [Flavobacterium sp.]
MTIQQALLMEEKLALDLRRKGKQFSLPNIAILLLRISNSKTSQAKPLQKLF